MVECAAIDRTAILKAWAVSLLRIQAKVGHALFTIEQRGGAWDRAPCHILPPLIGVYLQDLFSLRGQPE